MGFCDLLKANNIDAAKFIALQNEFIAQWRKQAEELKDSGNFRDFVEKDQMVTQLQKFINILERERVQEKINEVSGSES